MMSLVKAFLLPAGTFCSKIALVPNGAMIPMKTLRSAAARTAALNKGTLNVGSSLGPYDATLPKENVRLLSNL